MSKLYNCSWYCKVFDFYVHRVAIKSPSVVCQSNRRTLLTNAQHQSSSPFYYNWKNDASIRISPSRLISTSVVGRTQDSVKKTQSDVKGNEDSVVYVGTLARMVRFVKLFSLSSSIVGISIQPYIYKNVSQLPVALAAVVGGFMGFFILVTPLILHFVTKRYVTSITLNEASGQFTAITYSFFLTEKRLQFTAKDVKVPNVPGLFTTLIVNGKVPLFVDPSLFVSREAFLQLMKYDEPLEWEIEPDADEHEIKAQTKKKQETNQ